MCLIQKQPSLTKLHRTHQQQFNFFKDNFNPWLAEFMDVIPSYMKGLIVSPLEEQELTCDNC